MCVQGLKGLFNKQWCTSCFKMSFVVEIFTILKRDWNFTSLSYYLQLMSTLQFQMDIFFQLDQGWLITGTKLRCVWLQSLQILPILAFEFSNLIVHQSVIMHSWYTLALTLYFQSKPQNKCLLRTKVGNLMLYSLFDIVIT